MKLETILHKGYETCAGCGGLVIDTGSTWLGEDEAGSGRWIERQECEDCYDHRETLRYE